MARQTWGSRDPCCTAEMSAAVLPFPSVFLGGHKEKIMMPIEEPQCSGRNLALSSSLISGCYLRHRSRLR